ncbi:MAG TPA: sugar transferase [Micromonosporaceae bacterium]
MAATTDQPRAGGSLLRQRDGEAADQTVDLSATADLTSLLDAAPTVELHQIAVGDAGVRVGLPERGEGAGWLGGGEGSGWLDGAAGAGVPSDGVAERLSDEPAHSGRTFGDPAASSSGGDTLGDAPLSARHRAVAPDRRDARAVPPWARTYARALFALDSATVLGSVAVGYLVHSGWRAPSGAVVGYHLLLVVPWLLSLLLIRGYSDRVVGYGSDEYRRVTTATVRAAAAVAVAGYLLHVDLPREVVVPAFLCGLLGLPVERWAARGVMRWRRRAGDCCRRILVVGDLRHVTELVEQLRREPDAGYRVVGVCLPRGVYGRNTSLRDVPLIGSLSSIVEAAAAAGADTVAVTAAAELTASRLRRLGWALEGTGIELVVAPALTDVAGPRIHTRPVAGLPLIHVEKPEYHGGRALAKLVLDKVLAALALVLLMPVLVAIAIAVRRDSPGPVIFRQTRIGLHGRPFTVFKFRSMVVGAERLLADLATVNETDGPLFKMRDDPRVTRVGRVLRRWSLDELPQLVNVLRGEMSLVGPRPPLPHEVARYDGDVRRRLLVRPGLTGLWQVSGRSDLAWRDGVRLDLYYVENWSIATDLVILWQTVGAVLRRRGAY